MCAIRMSRMRQVGGESVAKCRLARAAAPWVAEQFFAFKEEIDLVRELEGA